MKNGWVKSFVDGQYITGIDGESSWSKTRLEGMSGAQIFHNGRVVEIAEGLGNYHQSDDFEVSVGGNDHKIIARRLQFWDKSIRQWKTVELDVKSGKIKTYYTDNRI